MRATRGPATFLAIVAAMVVTAACGATPSVTTSTGNGPSATATTGSAPSNSPEFQAYLDALRASSLPAAATTVRRDALVDAMGLRDSLGSGATTLLDLLSRTEAETLPTSNGVPAGPADGGIVEAVAIVRGVPSIPALPAELTVRQTLAPATDSVGRPGSGTLHTGPVVTVAASSEGGLAANVQVTTTVDTTVADSKVSVTVKRNVHATVSDTTSGGQVYDETRSHIVTGKIDVCPTATGASNGSVENILSSEIATFAGSGGRVSSHATAGVTSTSTFTGSVDDSAVLGAVTQNYVHDEQFHRTASAEGGPEATHEGSFQFSELGVGDGVPAAHDWSLLPGDHSASTGTIKQSGEVTTSMLVATAFSEADDFTTIDAAYVASQRLWRTNRCVEITSPTYNVESELVPSGLPAHTEEVEQASSTPFEAGLKHRFGAGLTATIGAELFDGKEKLTPGSIEKPPGTLTYQAPPEDGKDALVKLTSTSRQGIGTLTLKFHTGATKLKVSITGTMRTSGFGVSYQTKLSVTDLVLAPLSDGTYEGTAPAVVEIRLDIADCAKPYTSRGTMKLHATREKVEDQALERRWIVTFDPATTFATSGTCLGVPLDSFTGGAGASPVAGFMTVLDTLTFSQAGGPPQHIKKTVKLGASTNTIDATVTGTVVSESAN